MAPASKPKILGDPIIPASNSKGKEKDSVYGLPDIKHSPISRIEPYFEKITKSLKLSDNIQSIDSHVRFVLNGQNKPHDNLRVESLALKKKLGNRPEDPDVAGIIKIVPESSRAFSASITPIPSLQAHALWDYMDKRHAFTNPISLAVARDMVSVVIAGEEYLKFVLDDESGKLLHPNHKKLFSFSNMALHIMAHYTLPNSVLARSDYFAKPSTLIGVSATEGRSTFFQFITPFADPVQAKDLGEAQEKMQAKWSANHVSGKLVFVRNTAEDLSAFLFDPKNSFNEALRTSIVMSALYEHREKAAARLLLPGFINDLKKGGPNWEIFYDLSKVYGTLGENKKMLDSLQRARTYIPSDGHDAELSAINRFIDIQTGVLKIPEAVPGTPRKPVI